MAMKKSQKKRRKIALRPLLGAILLAGGLFRLAVPTFGITAAGQQIDNTATAQYEDDNNNTIDATSNTVSITVAEVAGITVVPAGVNDLNGGSINTNDIVGYQFTVTNTGNDTTRFFLPGSDNVTIPTANANFDFTGANNTPPPTGTVQVIAVNGVPLGTPVDVPTTGATTDILAGVQDDFNPGDNLTVRVNVKVTETTATAPITVRYGDTPPNDNTAPTQNQPSTGLAADVRTVDVPDGGNANEVAGPPVNDEREAAAVQTEQLNTVANNLALARLRKVASNVNNSGTDTTAQDDVITYDLTLNVGSTDPSGTFTPSNLTGTQVQVTDPGGTSVRTAILVSDVIPTGTVYDPTNEGTLSLPQGWTRVYATENPNNFSPIVIGGNTASSVNWTTAIPAPGNITRIGFIFDLAAIGNNPLPPGTVVVGTPPGAGATATPSFQFQVVTSGLAVTGGTVDNIAQVFGETVGVPNVVVYDESGDQDPNNFEGNVPPDPNNGTAFDPAVDTGIANPAANGVDNNNNNTGVGPKGEVNQVTIVANPVIIGGIFNGPNGQPQAIGPTNDNDDFTNLSTSDNPANNAGNFDPAGVIFTNTVQNPATNTAPLDNVTLEPLSPSQAIAARPGTVQGVNGVTDNTIIPDNTFVVIRFDRNNDGDFLDPDETGVYQYDQVTDDFAIVAADDEGNTTNLTDKNGDTNPDPINIGTLPIGASENYQVIINPPSTNQNRPIPVPIVAYPENILGSGFDPVADGTDNITIDRLYTGYLDLVKEARLLNADGTPAGTNTGGTPDGVFTNTPNFLPQPDQIIEYRITYTNISEVAVGSNNVLLNANNVVITEEGTSGAGAAAGNNWAADNDGNGEIDTSNVIGTVNASQGTTTPVANGVNDISGTTVASDVPVYTNSAGNVVPQGNGTLIFQRRINNSATPSNPPNPPLP